MRMLFAAAGAVLALGLTAPAAFAGDAACVWKNLPAARKAEPMRIAATSPVKAADAIQVGDDELKAALVACGVKEANWGAGARAAGRYTMAALGEEWFRVNRRIGPGPLDKAWRSLSDADRAVVKGQFNGANPPQAEVARVTVLFGNKLGLTDADLTDDGLRVALSAYLAGRAGAEAMEGEF